MQGHLAAYKQAGVRGATVLQARRQGSFGAWLGAFACLVVIVATYKQFAINAFGLSRGSVSAVVAAMMLALVSTCLIALSEKRRSWTLLQGLLALHVVVWHILAIWSVVDLGVDPRDVLVSLSYRVYGPLLILVPFSMSAQRVRFVLRILLWSAVPVFLIALIQVAVPDSELPAILATDERNYALVNVLGITRVNGLMGNHIEFSLFGALIVNLMFACKGRVSSFTMWGVLMLAGITLLLSSSRLFIAVAFVETFLWLLIMSGRQTAILALAAFATLVGAGLYMGGWDYLQAIFSLEENWSAKESTNTHFAQIGAALAGFADSPWYGTGVGSQSGADKIVTDGFWWALLLEGGVIGCVTYVAAIAYAGYLLAKRFVKGTFSKETRRLLFAALLSWGVVVVASMVNTGLNNQTNTLLYFLLLGAALGIARSKDSPGVMRVDCR